MSREWGKESTQSDGQRFEDVIGTGSSLLFSTR